MSEIKCPECGNELKLMYMGYEGEGVIELFHCYKCLRDWKRTFTTDNGLSELERKFWG